MPSPLPRPRRRRWLPIGRHFMRLRAEALARVRKARAGTYAPKPATHTPEPKETNP